MILLPFFLLSLSFISIWIRRDPKIWGSLLGLSLLAGFLVGNLSGFALTVIAGWAALWVLYAKKQTISIQIALFAALILISFGFKFHWFPGFTPVQITGKFRLGFDGPIVGLFPLALLVPLAKTWRDWKTALTKGLWLTCLGIGAMAVLAIASGTTHWESKLPSAAGLRYLNNLVLTAIPEEAFYRGFIQRELSQFFKNSRKGNIFALLFASLIFALMHLYWSPNLAILGFTFLAGLLYGGVYLLSGKLESAILCHFLLNFIHVTFFQYHAM